MKKISISLSTLLLTAYSSFSQPPTEKSLLWQINSANATKPSFLFGTIHLLCPDDIIVDDVLHEKFNATQQLFLELDLDNKTEMMQAMEEIKMKEDTSLHMLLDKTQYDLAAASFMQLANLPLALFNYTKPLLTMSAIYPGLLGCPAAEAWETQFVRRAKQNSIEIKGLETTAEQIEVLDAIPYGIQAGMLAGSLLDTDSLKSDFLRMINLYKQKDINGLYKSTLEDQDFASYEAILLHNRNKNWVPKIINEINSMPTFFAVGAAHLGGENGIIHLLRKAGYTVTAVMD